MSAADHNASIAGLTAAHQALQATAGVVTPELFGARADGVTDDTAALQAAINASKASGAPVRLASKTYRYTKSLDGTINANGVPVSIVGNGKRPAILLSDLTETYPALDLTNNKRGHYRNFQLRSTTTSLETCSMLLAEDTASSMNMATFEDLEIVNQAPNAKAAIVGVNADQVYMTRVAAQAIGAAAVAGYRNDGTNALGIASKYRTIHLDASDLTLLSVSNCMFQCAQGPALDASGFSKVESIDTYFNNVGAGSAYGMVRLESTSGRQMQALFYGLRTEDHGTKAGGGSGQFVDGVYVVDAVYNSIFHGAFTNDASVGAFAGPGTHYYSQIRAAAATLFNSAGPLVGCDVSVHGGSNSFGTLSTAGLAGSKNLRVNGRVGASRAALMATVATIPGLILEGLSAEDAQAGVPRSMPAAARVHFPRADSPTPYRPAWSGFCIQPLPAGYTGGSGLHTWATVLVPSAVLQWVGAAATDMVTPFARLEIIGDTTATWGASGEMLVSIVQGANTATLADLQGIPAGANGYKIDIRLMTNNGSTLFALTEIAVVPVAGGAPLVACKYVNLGAAGFSVADANDLSVRFVISNSADSPIGHTFAMLSG